MDTQEPMPIQSDGRLKMVVHTPGDGVVLRRSALMNEREEKKLRSRLASPIPWNQVLLIFSDHLGVTRDPAFGENIL